MSAPRQARILVVEDDPRIRGNVAEFLSEEGFDVVSADNGADAIALAEARTPDLVLCDIMLPGVDGYEVLEAVREFDEHQAFIFLSAKAERAEVRRGMNLGADDYLTKPFTLSELLETVETRLRRSDEIDRRIKEAVVEEGHASRRMPVPPFAPADGVVVGAPAMRAIYDQVAKVALSTLNVLLLGERGVGKEILARAVHNASSRSKGPFMALNCAALTESLLESELFGNEKAAFTGAAQARAGLLEAAAGGTVFLDEVGELPATIQAKLLRVLEERKVLRVGGRAPRDIDVRFVAATNRDVEGDVADGAFRADLCDRLNAFSVTIPPLRDRAEEIAPLARMFVARACASMGKRTVLPMTAECLQVLEQYPWPGNVRELKNAVEVAVALSETDALRAEDLPPRLRSRPRSFPPPGLDPRDQLRKQTDSVERQRILDAFGKTSNNQTLAAKLLGISRRTLINRMNTLGIAGPRKKKREDTGPETLRSSDTPPREGSGRQTKRPTISEEKAPASARAFSDEDESED